MANHLAAALVYAEKHSAHVFPLAPRSKVPLSRLVPNGFLGASVDPETIARWWRQVPDANIGIACAPSGFVVVDVDPRNGGDETFGALQRELGPMPPTWTDLTPGNGQHYYLRDCVGEYVASLGPGVDVKYRGYVVAPPSVHPSGGIYQWDVGAHPSESEVATIPDGWLARMTVRARRQAMPSSGDDARNSFLGAAFEHQGHLGDALVDGKRMVRCPWFETHSDQRGDGKDSSTIIFPRAQGKSFGGFHCSHSHCAHRSWKDVIATFTPDARSSGAKAADKYAPISIWEDGAGWGS